MKVRLAVLLAGLATTAAGITCLLNLAAALVFAGAVASVGALLWDGGKP